ncbi:MAG: hypothetical protein E7384_01085 [Ruminococcaceae bacterium]|nr:hypothetical protein [Oscillospiraceae bacterium]
MEIKATSKFDYETMRDYVRFSAVPKSDAKKHMIFNIFSSVAAIVVIIFVMFLFGISKTMLVLLIGIIIMFGISLFMYYVMPKIQYNSLGKMQNVENEFTFYDDYLRATSNTDGINGESKMKYCMIEKVIEKPRYIYIYQNKRQAFIVDKTTITGGTVEDIRNLLMPILQDKYYCYNN